MEGFFIFLNDIFICGSTQAKILQRLQTILEWFAEYGVVLREDKCLLIEPEVCYLVHVLDVAGLHLDDQKTKLSGEQRYCPVFQS